MDTGNADGKGPFPGIVLTVNTRKLCAREKDAQWKATEDHGVAEQV
jgi:hypothetical protein